MLGYRNVALFADPELLGGSFTMAPKAGVAEIVVGTRYDYWREVLEVLLHEATEFAFCDVNARFKQSPCVKDGHDGYLFSTNHDGFSDAVARAAMFVAASQKHLAKIHRQHVRARRR